MEKSKKIPISGKDYIVNFPSVGQILDIESLKSALTNGQYGDFVNMGTKTATDALDLVDAFSVFSILIPELKDELNVKTFMEMDPFIAKKYVNAYKKHFFPWFKEINDELRKFGKDDE
jgi:hypothetical protein